MSCASLPHPSTPSSTLCWPLLHFILRHLISSFAPLIITIATRGRHLPINANKSDKVLEVDITAVASPLSIAFECKLTPTGNDFSLLPLLSIQSSFWQQCSANREVAVPFSPAPTLVVNFNFGRNTEAFRSWEVPPVWDHLLQIPWACRGPRCLPWLDHEHSNTHYNCYWLIIIVILTLYEWLEGLVGIFFARCLVKKHLNNY